MPERAAIPITTSIFELFKAGPGPSSSHTIAPMLAGLDFRALLGEILTSHPENRASSFCGASPAPTNLERAASLRVRLFGSLSATGYGHGTDKAVLTGLLGHEPPSCPDNLPQGVFDLPEAERVLRLGNGAQALAIPLGPENVVFDSVDHPYPCNNTLRIELLDASGQILLDKTYYSVGGGFLQWEDWTPPLRGKAPFPYHNAATLRRHAEENALSIPEIILSNEMAMTGKSRIQIIEELDLVIQVMRRSVERGIRREGLLPGNLGVYRKAAHLARKSDAMDDPLNRFLGLLNAYAFAVAEENAAGGMIVTAPTCGSAGVLASVLTIMEGYLGFGPEGVRGGLLAAAAVGLIARHNAGIAGAEVGCQGEIGVASAMGAAMLAQARGFAPQIVENAAEIALEHHLGLTCDPVGGYVQIPCIERNAMGALKSYNACLVASAEDASRHRVTLDMAVKAMAETGRDMDGKYKETAQGGLAVSMTEC
ncbi:L-serine ammonia-lyase [Desulfovibrio sp. OttesenSCG-928-C14]|nr:L-serine ammonia-lyase [Desulfovibrio sp. OttesenSCG-928-C14]